MVGRRAEQLLDEHDGDLELLLVEKRFAFGRERAVEETEGDQTDLERQVGLAQIQRVSESGRERAQQFAAREEALRERIADPAE